MATTSDEEQFQPGKAQRKTSRHKKRAGKRDRTDTAATSAAESGPASQLQSYKLTEDQTSCRYMPFMKKRAKHDKEPEKPKKQAQPKTKRSSQPKQAPDAEPSQQERGTDKLGLLSYDKKQKHAKQQSFVTQRVEEHLAAASSEDEAAIYHMDFDGDGEGNGGSHDASHAYAKHKLRYKYNLLLYIIFGYLVGIALVLIWYYWHQQVANRDLTGKWLAIVLLVLLLFMLCLSRGVRCVLVLMLPTLSSYKGRALLIAIAFFIAVTGPLMNIIRNIQLLVHSMACEQSQLQQALLPMLDIVENPTYAVEQLMYTTISELRRIIERLDAVLMLLEHDVARLFAGYRSCSSWLQERQTYFDHLLDTPYERCISGGRVGIESCHSNCGPKEPACNATQFFEWFCANLKELKTFFDQSVELQQTVLNTILQRLQQTFLKLREMFEVSIGFDHDLKQHSHDMGNTTELQAELKSNLNTQHYLFVFFWLDVVIIILLLTVLLRSIYFHMRYLSNDDYDNIYLMRDFYEIDKQQQRLQRPSVLPLQAAEKHKYIKLSSRHLLPVELHQMSRSVLHMFITGAQLFCICFFEYCLFQMLALISYFSHQMSELKASPLDRLVVEGGGMVGDILRSVVGAFEPLAKHYAATSSSSCVLLPVPPNYMRYYELLALCLFIWLQLLWEPYGLRMRHSIMACFYPADAHRRASYLHRRILLQRGSFIKHARRRARAVHRYVDGSADINWIRRRCSWFCNVALGPIPGKFCIICSETLTSENTIMCETPDCKGVYCSKCYRASNYKCCLCNPPAAYGDPSDLSDISDSSDDPNAAPFRPEGVYCDR